LDRGFATRPWHLASGGYPLPTPTRADYARPGRETLVGIFPSWGFSLEDTPWQAPEYFSPLLALLSWGLAQR
ncbi:MAG: hypothetical protein BRC49_02095, partial [Cyanobacteria bacterium SW_10_48_33]